MPRRRNSRSAEPVVDKISTLPDEILCRILSFLTTKEAVSTSILSKRWTHLCHRVLNLRFTNIKLNAVKSILRFNQSVYSVLVSRQTTGSNSINEFHLDIQYSNPNHGYRHGFPHVVKWINLFVQRNLEHLHLHINGIHTKLPISIFTCKTLVSLYLCGFYVEFSSNGFRFPSLKTLHLVTITFQEVKDFVLLIAGCPILEDLEVYDLRCNNVLDSLTIQEYKSLSFPRLTRARIRGIVCDFPAIAFSNSESLSIDTIIYTNEKLNQLKTPCDDIYIFHNLTHLEMQEYWHTVLRLLHLCPKLQNLKLGQKFTVAMTTWNEEDDHESYAEPEFVPQCLLSNFRTCTIEEFLGRTQEFLLAAYILRNAKNLQTMTIKCYRRMLKLENRLSQCLKASATCQLSVYIE
ncbi:hypothetical protein TSUD_35650 [Trifolium subterraneum]|uniref:F-box domain-containing protein n=1 Tax=Trifolium subterraneum TaxID=3900 RepID=A0A2Z6MKR6_TRISU|nr:hypothetical protein TSUD_35650 [Trifolium subterraneum]